VNDVAVAGDYAYILDYGFRVVDISNPAAPTTVGSVQMPVGQGNEWGVTVAGAYAYVANSIWGLRVIDVSDPSDPRVVGTADTSRHAWSSAVGGGYAYVADDAGLEVVDISTPTAPGIIGNYGVRGSCANVAVAGPFVFITENNLKILPIQCATTGVGPDPALAPAVARIDPNFPNPFSGSTVIPYALPAPAMVSLRVYDVSGRLVRALEENASRGSGRHVASWNGRDGQGGALPAGVYFCRLDADGQTETRHLVLLK
jgi:hypothetical protein